MHLMQAEGDCGRMHKVTSGICTPPTKDGSPSSPDLSIILERPLFGIEKPNRNNAQNNAKSQRLPVVVSMRKKLSLVGSVKCEALVGGVVVALLWLLLPFHGGKSLLLPSAGALHLFIIQHSPTMSHLHVQEGLMFFLTLG